MYNIERPSEFRNISGRLRIKVSERQLDNRRRIDDPTISFSKPTSTRSNGLLTNLKNVTVRPERILATV